MPSEPLRTWGAIAAPDATSMRSILTRVAGDSHPCPGVLQTVRAPVP